MSDDNANNIRKAAAISEALYPREDESPYQAPPPERDDLEKRLDAAIDKYVGRLDAAREENARLRRELAALQDILMTGYKRHDWVRTFAAAALARDDATPSQARSDALDLWDELERAFQKEAQS